MKSKTNSGVDGSGDTAESAAERQRERDRQFDRRVGFNWGFHDGTRDGAAGAPARDVSGECAAYVAGHARGVASYKSLGYRLETSEPAWLEYLADESRMAASGDSPRSSITPDESKAGGDED